MQIDEIIKIRRKLLGLTQQMLIQKAGVSMATLQKIEAGIANPSVLVLDQILKPLNLKTQIEEIDFNWDILCALGLPITPVKKVNGLNFNEENLIYNIKMGCLDLIEKKNKSRFKIAMESLILAIKHHYPTIFKKNLEKAPLIYEHFFPKKITGTHIKLRRLALAKIGQYL